MRTSVHGHEAALKAEQHPMYHTYRQLLLVGNLGVNRVI